MLTNDFQQVTRQNQQLKSELMTLKTRHSCLENDLQTQLHITNRQNHRLQELQQQVNIAKQQLDEQKVSRDHLEHRYSAVLQKLEEELDQYKQKYNKLENKIAPLVDHDTVRLKVLNEVEGNHHLQTSHLKHTIETLRDEILKFKRQNQVLRYSLENQRMNREEEVRRLRGGRSLEAAQDEFNSTTAAVWREMEARLQQNYDRTRKEAQYYKEKYFTCQKKYHEQLSLINVLQGGQRIQ